MKKLLILFALFLGLVTAEAQKKESGENDPDLKRSRELVAKKDYEQAIIYLTRSAERGNVTAISTIAYMHYGGYGVSQNYGTALEWYKKAIDIEKSEKTAEVMCIISGMYYEGLGTTKNSKEAMKWLKMAAEYKDADSMRRIGDFYMSGKGEVKTSVSEGIKWYEKAYNAGIKELQGTIAEIYEFGYGDVEKNSKLAKEWKNK
ncbi:sel1 repeat family protein [Sphingobacterium kitahiroshimense]|uniref:tetratricopeptide repeat protein n=1 Tax=Sphingobacterium sp. B16(2022) TaxID=2914044 RepID=UPI00143A3FD5|nr:tetratricopeptide repeat protein [Sphingobacterium sp. B16(2022)]NJI75432.1 sel1 repeat family protein [Sphingobacterium sp. B16(2022)]